MRVLMLPNTLVGDPEVVAMLQAFYSRSHSSIAERLETLGDDLVKIKDSLRKFYVNYGHSSIGDCGDVTLFIEDVSIIAAKWIQDFPLYNGQETSTRYIDFTKQGFVTDSTKPELADVIPAMVKYVAEIKPQVVDYLKTKHEKPADASDTVWERAINARAFDIVRGFLPAGCKTQLSIKASLRKLQEHFHALQHLRGDLPEVADIADEVLKQLREVYPSSFYAESDERSRLNLEHQSNYVSVVAATEPLTEDEVNFKFVVGDPINIKQARNKHEPISSIYDFAGDAYFELCIDFGCWRDLQRHRRINSPMPYFGIGSDDLNLNTWYINNLPPELRESVVKFYYELYARVSNAYQFEPTATSQYYMPLGRNITSMHKAPLSALIYMLELRSGKRRSSNLA
jgi:thymidylate synthase ThyX